MDKTHDYRYHYHGYHGPGGMCRIRIFEQDGMAPVVIATELPENENTSITTLAEYLAETLVWG